MRFVRQLSSGLMLIALAALPLVAATPGYPPVDFPARDSYRKPSETWGTPPFRQYAKLTVSPAKFPEPLLKYRFNVYSTELETGNSAPLYSQAFAEYQRNYVEAENRWYASNEYFALKKSGASKEKLLGELFRAVPLWQAWIYSSYPKAITPDDEARFYRAMGPVDRLLERASCMRYADWSYRTESQEAPEVIDHTVQTRALARYLSGKSGWEIRNGKYEEAVKTLRNGFALSSHLSRSAPPTLLSPLVGIAIHGIIRDRLMDLASQPDAPNLYPALTQIILPADAFQFGLQAEQTLMFSATNAVRTVEDVERASPEQCRQMLETTTTLIRQIDNPLRGNTSLSLAALCTLCYPHARDRLIAQGRKADDVEKLSVCKVVAPYVFEEMKSAYDKLLVAATFSPDSPHTAIVVEDPRFHAMRSPVDVYLKLLVPSLDAAQRANLHMQQRLELLKIVEAIRYYAAVHDGRLPPSLGDIKEVVIAINDPMTGKPFGYQVQGRTIFIDSSWLGTCRLELTVDEPAGPRKTEK